MSTSPKGQVDHSRVVTAFPASPATTISAVASLGDCPAFRRLTRVSGEREASGAAGFTFGGVPGVGTTAPWPPTRGARTFVHGRCPVVCRARRLTVRSYQLAHSPVSRLIVFKESNPTGQRLYEPGFVLTIC